MTTIETIFRNRISYLQKQNKDLISIQLETEERLDRQKATIIRQRDTIEALYKENNSLQEKSKDIQAAYDVVCGYNTQQSETIIDLKEKLENQRSVSEVLMGLRNREIEQLCDRLKDTEQGRNCYANSLVSYQKELDEVRKDLDAFQASNTIRGENIANLEKQNIEYELALRAMRKDRDMYRDAHRIALERIFNFQDNFDKGCLSCGYGKRIRNNEY